VAARIGFAAKGIVYILVGILAGMQAVGLGGRTASPSEALEVVRGGTFGTVLLWALAIGLAAYVLWCAFSAIADPERHGRDVRGLAMRIGDAVRAIVYGGLAVTAFAIAKSGGSGAGSGGGGARSRTEELLSQPAGPWIVGAIAAILAGYALIRLRKVWTAEFMDELRLHGGLARRRDVVRRIGQAGIGSQALVLLMISGFLGWAAIDQTSRHARGLEGALITLAQQPYGPVLLGLAALGLIAFGVFQGIIARYKAINPSPGPSFDSVARMAVRGG
jgi:hypothetical protein